MWGVDQFQSLLGSLPSLHRRRQNKYWAVLTDRFGFCFFFCSKEDFLACSGINVRDDPDSAPPGVNMVRWPLPLEATGKAVDITALFFTAFPLADVFQYRKLSSSCVLCVCLFLGLKQRDVGFFVLFCFIFTLKWSCIRGKAATLPVTSQLVVEMMSFWGRKTS